MSFCEFCGKQIEDGKVCECQDSRGELPQQPPVTPVYDVQQAQQYNPQQAQPPMQQQPPQYNPNPQQPPQYNPQQAPPQYGQFQGQPQQGYGQYAPPQGPPTPGAAAQTFGALKDTLGGFAKDPYGAATRAGGLSMSVSITLLVTQVIAFTLMISVAISRFVDFVLKQMGGSSAMIKEYKKELMDAIETTEYVKIAVCAAIGIASLFVCIFLAAKIAKIYTDPKTMLSSLAMSSIMMSAAFVVVVVLLFLLGFSTTGVGLCYMAICMGSIASLLLLEISMRGVMPPNTGNVKRLVCLTVSYAVSHVVTIFLISKFVYGDAFESIIYEISNAMF